MTPKNLFNIIIKIFGFFFLKEIIDSVPQLVASLLYFTHEDGISEGIWTLLLSAFIVFFYSFIVILLIFKTNIILTKLKLDQGFDQTEFIFNISSSSVMTISLLVTSGVILINEIPNFCIQLFSYFQEKRLTYGMTKPDFSYSVISGVKILIALLLIGERKRIVAFIEKPHAQNQADNK